MENVVMKFWIAMIALVGGAVVVAYALESTAVERIDRMQDAVSLYLVGPAMIVGGLALMASLFRKRR